MIVCKPSLLYRSSKRFFASPILRKRRRIITFNAFRPNIDHCQRQIGVLDDGVRTAEDEISDRFTDIQTAVIIPLYHSSDGAR